MWQACSKIDKISRHDKRNLSSRCDKWVESRQPHVSHDQLQRILGILEPRRHPLLLPLAIHRILQSRPIRGRARHHDPERAVLVIPADVLAVLRQLCARPLRAQIDDLIEKAHANVPAHRHDHRLAFQRARPRLVVLYQIRGDHRQPPKSGESGKDTLSRLPPRSSPVQRRCSSNSAGSASPATARTALRIPTTALPSRASRSAMPVLPR
jgi:hypothetical protein